MLANAYGDLWATQFFELMGPDVKSVANSIINARTGNNATSLLLALKIHHARHGAWPASLDTLDVGLLDREPTGWFTGGPLWYKLGQSGPEIYSFGPDADDEGGRPQLPNDRASERFQWVPPTSREDPFYDIDWTLYPPQNRSIPPSPGRSVARP